MLIAVADGLAMRALADPDSRIIDRTRRRCLLSTAAFALIAGCLERADASDGLSLEQAVRAVVCGPPADSGQKQP